MPLVDIPGIGRAEFPDNMPHEEIIAAIDRTIKHKAGQMALEGAGPIERGVIGAGKAVSDAWQGLKQITGFADKKDVAETRARDSALMETTAGKVGNFAGNVGMAVPTMFVPGVNTYTGAAAVGGLLGGVQPVGEGESRALNTAVGAGGGLLGQYAGNKVGNYIGTRLANKQNQLTAEQAKNTARDSTISQARDAGYVFPPTSVNAGPVNSVLEAVSGKIKTAQAASFKNADVTDQLAKQAIGLAPDDVLNKASLQAVRDQAGQAYQVVEGLNSVNWDQQFQRGIRSLASNQSSGAVKNPANKEIGELVDGLINKAQWTGRELVDDIKLLREMGHANKSAASRAGGDTAKSSLGRAQLKAAELLEELADRNLAVNKAPASAIQDLRAGRELIAKTYSVQKALNESSGRIDASVLASELKKGKPLTAELELIARTAQSFPKATQNADKIGSVNPLSAVDAMGGTLLGGVTAAATGNPLGLLAAAAPVARPAARAAVLSGPYQRSMVTPPNYRPGLMYTGPDALAWNPFMRRALPPATAMGLLGYTPQQ